jgi:DNA polymerase-3 subunit beta
MKFSILQENLKNGLARVSHIAGKNPNLPILNNLMIEVKEGGINLIATDLEIGMRCAVRGKIEEEGSYTVDAKIFADYISLLPNQKINISQKNKTLDVAADNYNTNIKGQEADDYPLIPQIDKEESFVTDKKIFRQALQQVIFATSTNETRIELSGVLFVIQENKLSIAATDSYRLAEKTINIKTKNTKERQVIIPAKTIQELIRVLTASKNEELDQEQAELVEVFLSENQLLVDLGNTEVVSRLIEGQYPDYKQIIPSGSKTQAVVDRSEFVRATKAASLFSKSGVNDINIDLPVKKKKVVISSASGQTGENISELNAEIKGEENSIVVNYRYLLDGVNNINSDRIKLEVIDGNTPCILRPENDESYLYIIMPIKK